MIVADTDRGDLGDKRAAGDQAQEERNRVRGAGQEREADLSALWSCKIHVLSVAGSMSAQIYQTGSCSSTTLSGRMVRTN